MRQSLLLAAASSLVGFSPAIAADIEASSAIDAVLVFPSAADVTRLGEVELPAGDHRVLIKGLPRSTDANSLRISFGSEAIIVGAVEASSVVPDTDRVADAQALRDEVDAIQDRIQAVRDRTSSAQLQLRFLESQATAPVANTEWTPAAPSDWATAVQAIADGANAARAEILKGRQDLRGLNTELAEARQRLSAFDDDLSARTDVAVSITAEEAVTTDFGLQYQVRDTGWTALYDARLDSLEAELTLERKVRVRQDTGEDWSGVRLSLSTAPPTNQLSAPDVGTRYLSLFIPPRTAERYDRSMAESEVYAGAVVADMLAATGVMPAEQAADEAGRSSPAASTSRTREIASANASFTSTFSVGGRIDVASDNVERTFSLGEEAMPVELVVRAAPRLNPAGFLTAKLTYEGDAPLPAGSLRKYRDGAFLRPDRLEPVIPGQEMELGFGQDQAMVVTWVNEGGLESETGLVGRTQKIDENHVFTATNRHGRPFTVEIVDYRPVSQDDDISVKVGVDASTPDLTDFADSPGVIAWRRELAPGEELQVRNSYEITYPGKAVLAGR